MKLLFRFRLSNNWFGNILFWIFRKIIKRKSWYIRKFARKVGDRKSLIEQGKMTWSQNYYNNIPNYLGKITAYYVYYRR